MVITHVHLILTPLPDGLGYLRLATIMKGIKGASSHSVDKLLKRRGLVWIDEWRSPDQIGGGLGGQDSRHRHQRGGNRRPESAGISLVLATWNVQALNGSRRSKIRGSPKSKPAQARAPVLQSALLDQVICETASSILEGCPHTVGIVAKGLSLVVTRGLQ